MQQSINCLCFKKELIPKIFLLFWKLNLNFKLEFGLFHLLILLFWRSVPNFQIYHQQMLFQSRKVQMDNSLPDAKILALSKYKTFCRKEIRWLPIFAPFPTLFFTSVVLDCKASRLLGGRLTLYQTILAFIDQAKEAI